MSCVDVGLSRQLHWDTYWNVIQRRKVVEERLQQGRSRPVPPKVSESSLEAKLIWRYLGCEPPIHFRRTLDQFGYSNLRSTVARDDDQMLWKRTRKEVNLETELGDSAQIQDASSLPKPFLDGKVLMVDQLWLWIVDQRTVVTFFPRQEATTSESKLHEQANLHNSIYNELNGDLARRFETASDLAALIVLHATTGIHRTLHHDLQALRIFEESISILVNQISSRDHAVGGLLIVIDRVVDQVVQALPQSRVHRKARRPKQDPRGQENDTVGARLERRPNRKYPQG